MRRFCVLFIGVAVVFAERSRAGENWPRFRGAAGMSVAADDPRLPTTWSRTKNIMWTTSIPGRGWSSPVVWGAKVFLTSVTNDKPYEGPKKGLYLGRGRPTPPAGVHHWMVFCLDLVSGDILWNKEAHAGEPRVPRHPKSTYAAETSATDGSRLYVLFGDLGLYCYDFDGNLLWSRPIEPKKTKYGYGAASSPVVHGDQVIVVYDNEDASYIAAFDTRTGRVKWKRERDERSTWATPYVWQNTLRTEIVVPGERRNGSYDLEGNVLWHFDGKMTSNVIPSPFSAHGMVYVTSGYVGDPHRPVYAIRPGASGDISLKEGESRNEYIRWYQPLAGPYNTSPIVYNGLYYTLHDRGFLTCHDAKTGQEIYGKTRLKTGATFTASPWAYNGHVFCLSEDGDTYVVRRGSEFELLAVNSLDEVCLASPAVAQGRLLIRTASKLYGIANEE